MAQKNLGREDNLYEPSTTKTVIAVKSDEIRIPIIEEKAIISKEVVESGRVRISKQVENFEEIISIDLSEDVISFERKLLNQPVQETPKVRQEGDTTIYPVLKEIVVVEKRLILVEEIHITRKKKVHTANETVSLRREIIDVKREGI